MEDTVTYSNVGSSTLVYYGFKGSGGFFVDFNC